MTDSIEPERWPLATQPELIPPLQVWTAASATAPVVLVIPALGTPAGVYRRFALALQAAGVHAAVLELRGVGQSPLRARCGVDWGYADLVQEEVHGAWQVLRARWPLAPLYFCGHSLGGHLSLLHQARYPDAPVAGVLLMASGAPYHRAYPGWSGLATRALGAFAALSTRWLGHFPGHWLGFGGRQGATLMREWSGFVRTGQPQVSGWSDEAWRARLAALTLPSLALVLPGDAYAPHSSTAHLLGLTRSAAHIERLQRDQVVPGHFAFLRCPQPVVQRMVDWMRTQPQNAASNATTPSTPI